MEKIKLNLDELKVDTFETETAEAVAYSTEAATCGWTCPDTCPPRSCNETVWGPGCGP